MTVENKEFVILEKKESLFDSIVSDAVTFGFLIFSIWFSFYTKSTIWEYVTVLMFFLGLVFKLGFSNRPTVIKLKNKQEAIAWANSLKC